MDKLKMDRSKNIFIRRIGFMLVALIGLLLALAVQAADSTQLSGHKGDVNSVAVSADGTLVVSAGDGTVYLIDLHGKVVHTWRMPYPAGQYGYLTEKGTLFYNGKI